MKKLFISVSMVSVVTFSCNNEPKENSKKEEHSENHKETIENKEEKNPSSIEIKGIAQNPEGIEYNKNNESYLLSSLNAGPIIQIEKDGTYKAFTSGEQFPMSTAGLQIDYKNNRLLATAFNGLELLDNDPNTKGISNLRIYNLETGVLENDINLSSLVPDAKAYFANDVTVDNDGNAYVTDWYAGVVYKVNTSGEASILWKNETGIPSGSNGIDYHPDGYLLVSLVSVNEKGLYADYGLVKIPLEEPQNANLVEISSEGFTGFDGMVFTQNRTVIGITNDGTNPGGNTIIELSSNDKWKTAEIVNSKSITASTTVAITPENLNYVINQDFQDSNKDTWLIEQVKF